MESITGSPMPSVAPSGFSAAGSDLTDMIPIIPTRKYDPTNDIWREEMDQITQEIYDAECFRFGEEVEKLTGIRTFEGKLHDRTAEEWVEILAEPSNSSGTSSAVTPKMTKIKWVRSLVIVLSAVGYALATGYDTPSPSVESVWDYIRRSVRTVTFYGRIEDIVFADEMKSDDPRHLEKAYWTLKNMSTLPDADRLYFNVAYATQAAWTSYRAWIKKDRQQRLATQNRIDEDLKFGLLPEVNGRKTNYGEDLTAYRLRLAMQNRNELKPANVAAADGNLDVVSFLARLEERQQAKDEAFLAALEALKKKAHENRPVDVTRVKYHGEKFRDSDNPFRWFRRWEQRAVSAKITDIDSMLAWLPQAISAEHAPVATHYVHTIESLGVPESVDELREQFIMAVTDEKARAPSTLYNVLLTMTWDPVVKQLKPYSLDFESAYTDLLDANKIEPHRKFEPTNQSLASAYWSSLGIADIRALTKDIDQNLPLKDVIRETLRIIDMTYDRGEPSVMSPVKAGSNVSIEKKEVVKKPGSTRLTTTYTDAGSASRKTSRFTKDSVQSKTLTLKTPNQSSIITPKTRVTAAPSGAKVDSEIDALTKQLENLKLAKAGISRGFNKENVTCFRCGEKGHYAWECQADGVTPAAHGYLVVMNNLESDDSPEFGFDKYDESMESLYEDASRMYLLKYDEETTEIETGPDF